MDLKGEVLKYKVKMLQALQNCLATVTVITMLSRLEGKEAVRHEEGRRAKLYW